MKEIVPILVLTVIGPVFLWLGVRALRSKAWNDGVPALELLIVRVAGVDPPARTLWDRRFALFQSWAMTIFGFVFTLALLAILYSLISE